MQQPFWVELLIILAMVMLSLFVFYAVRTYILTKVRINKWIPLVIMGLLLLIPFFLGTLYVKYRWIQYISMFLVSLCMLTYLELSRMAKEEKNKPVVGRPKPNPRRAQKKD